MFPSIIYSKPTFDAFYQTQKVYIIKPIGGYSGYGIQVSDNKEIIEQLIHKLYQDGVQHIMVSEYMTNPLLFNNKKFHIRLYYLPVVKDNKFEGFLLRKGFIYTAKQDWTNDAYYNTNIHDSHFWKTDKDYFYPDSLYDKFDTKIVKYIHKQITTILVIINKYFRKFAFPYPESHYAYEMFGCDFMVDTKFNVKLLEINFNPTRATKTKKNGTMFSKYLFEGIASNILESSEQYTNMIQLGKYHVTNKERMNPCKIM